MRPSRLAVSSFPVSHTMSSNVARGEPGRSSARTTISSIASARQPLSHGRGRNLGLVPDAAPRASDPCPVRSCRLAPRAVARLCRNHPGAPQPHRAFLAGCFGAVAMDEGHFAAALRYVSLNRCGRGWSRAQGWRWSNTRAHLRGRDGGLTARQPFRDVIADFAGLLSSAPEGSVRVPGRRREHRPAARQ
jgi:hypothetical protein